MQIKVDQIDELVDIGISAIRDNNVLNDLSDAITKADRTVLTDTLDLLKKFRVNGTSQHRAVSLLTGMINGELSSAPSAGSTNTNAALSDIDPYDLSSITSEYNVFSMSGCDGVRGSVGIGGVNSNGNYSPSTINLVLFFNGGQIVSPRGKMTVTVNASSGFTTRWEGSLQDFVVDGGVILNSYDKSRVYPSQSEYTLIRHNKTESVEKTELAVKPPDCSCGAIFFGASEYGPGHNSTCKRFSK